MYIVRNIIIHMFTSAQNPEAIFNELPVSGARVLIVSQRNYRLNLKKKKKLNLFSKAAGFCILIRLQQYNI